MSTSHMRSSILGIYHPGGGFHPSAINNGQFDKLTDRTAGELRSLSLPKGPAAEPLSTMSVGFGNRLLTVFLVLQA